MSFDNIANKAAETVDLTDESSGGFTRELPRAGVALFRLRDYIELGHFDSNNPKYKPALKTQLVFELHHPDHIREIDGDKFPDLLIVRVNHARGGKSRYIRLFKKMNYTGNKTHFAQMLGDSFLGAIHHKADANDPKKIYVNLDDENGDWTIGAPRVVDPLTTEVTEVPIPEQHGTSRLFLWENEGLTDADVKEMWDSIYIEGENSDGKSKNFLQEAVKSSNGWTGSQTQQVVDAGVLELPNAVTDAALVKTTEAVEEDSAKPTPVTAGTTEGEVDPLAALGLA